MLCMYFAAFAFLTGCGTSLNHTAANEVISYQSSIRESQAVAKPLENYSAETLGPGSLPGLSTNDNVVSDTLKLADSDTIQRIDLLFDKDGVFGGSNRSIQIRDPKIISDILKMIAKSKTLPDGYDTKMSGMGTKNSMVLYSKQGKKEITFSYDDPAFARGYLQIGSKKADPGYDFFRYINDFTEYRQFDTKVEKQTTDLFGKYGWTVDYRISTFKKVLPGNLKHKAGEYPEKIYWAYNNELSKSIGLDFSKYPGKTIQAELYRLREPLPDFMSPRMNARGIVLKAGGKIIGAYIDAGRHDCFACSLARKSLKEITGRDWDNWIGDYIDYKDGYECKLSKMQPRDIIKLYYDAMNKHDDKTEYACMTRQYICGFLAMNMDNNRLFNENYASAYSEGSNIQSVKLIKLREENGLSSGNPAGMVEIEATVDYRFKKEITSNNGVQPRFIILKKETERSGWRIASVGTGP